MSPDNGNTGTVKNVTDAGIAAAIGVAMALSELNASDSCDSAKSVSGQTWSSVGRVEDKHERTGIKGASGWNKYIGQITPVGCSSWVSEGRRVASDRWPGYSR